MVRHKYRHYMYISIVKVNDINTFYNKNYLYSKHVKHIISIITTNIKIIRQHTNTMSFSFSNKEHAVMFIEQLVKALKDDDALVERLKKVAAESGTESGTPQRMATMMAAIINIRIEQNPGSRMAVYKGKAEQALKELAEWREDPDYKQHADQLRPIFASKK